MRAPSHREILQAEQRLMQARRELAAGGPRLGAAVRATLVKPSVLLGVAAAAGIAGYLVSRRSPAKVERSHGGAAAGTPPSLVGLVVTLAMRYAMQRLPGIGLQLFEQAVRKAGSPSQPSDPRPSYRPGATLH